MICKFARGIRFASSIISYLCLLAATAFAEPGHPLATPVAYRPLLPVPPFEGMITLEFSDPDKTTPTDSVTVTVVDLNQVVQQTDTNVLVPNLQPGQRFRVAIALGPSKVTSANSNWLTRYGNGINLRFSTAKVNSSYGQMQSSPILKWPAAACWPKGSCELSSPPSIANLRPGGLSSGDAGISVGQYFVVASDQTNFAVFWKQLRAPINITGSDINPTSVAATHSLKPGGAANLFEEFWCPGAELLTPPGQIQVQLVCTDAATASRDVNHTITASPLTPIACNPNDPMPLDLNGNPIVPPSEGWPSTACINQVYDSRAAYDPGHARFWVVSHAANDQGGGDPGVVPAPKQCDGLSFVDCANHQAELRHQVFVAVSNTEIPSSGFRTYVLDDLNEDWEMFGVQGRYALVYYHGPHNDIGQSRVRVYDADALVQGSQVELTPPNLSATLSGGEIRLPKHHNIPHNIAYIPLASGNNLNLYAFNAASGMPKLLGPATYIDSAEKFDSAWDNFQSVVRGNFLYIVTMDPPVSLVPGKNCPVANTVGEHIVVWRIPFSLSNNGTVGIDANNVNRWIIKDPNAKLNFDYPTIDVTKNNDIVVSFRAWAPGVPDQVWYDVLYYQENNFRQPANLPAPPNGPTSGCRIDFESSSVDPTDDETVWITGDDANGPIVTSVRP